MLPKKQKSHQFLRYAVGPIVSFTIFWGLFRWVDFTEFGKQLSALKYEWLVLAIAITTIIPLAGARRWKTIVNCMGNILSLKQAVIVTMAAFPLNAFLPSKAGDLSKAAFLRERGGFVPLAGSVLFERLIDVAVLSVMSLVGSYFLGQQTVFLLSLLCVAGTLLGIVFLIFAHKFPLPVKLSRMISEIGMAGRMVLCSQRTIGLVILWSILNWLGTLLEAYCIFRAVQADISFILVLATLPLAIFAGLLPLTMSGMGTRDSALLLLLTHAAPAENILAAGLLYTAVSYWFLALIGLPFLLFSVYRPIKSSQSTQELR